MTLNNCDINKKYSVKSINTNNNKLKLRLYEIGFFNSSEVRILNKSFAGKTLLISVLDSCFAIKSEMAKCIEVEDA